MDYKLLDGEMKIDIHIHVNPYSLCSKMSMEQYRKVLREHDVKVACVTDHSELKGNSKLKSFNDVEVITGMEVTTGLGDFLIYSTDKEYLRRFVYATGEDAPLILLPFNVEDFEQ